MGPESAWESDHEGEDHLEPREGGFGKHPLEFYELELVEGVLIMAA
jgi:hypothetical protein